MHSFFLIKIIAHGFFKLIFIGRYLLNPVVLVMHHNEMPAHTWEKKGRNNSVGKDVDGTLHTDGGVVKWCITKDKYFMIWFT